jgi:hypothetical protein
MRSTCTYVQFLGTYVPVRTPSMILVRTRIAIRVYVRRAVVRSTAYVQYKDRDMNPALESAPFHFRSYGVIQKFSAGAASSFKFSIL